MYYIGKRSIQLDDLGVKVETVPGYTRIYPDIPGGGPGRFVSNVLARVLILINLRGVELGVGPGEGVRYYKGLEIRVRVRVMMGRTSLIPTRPTLTIKPYPPILSKAAHQAPNVF